MSKALNTAVGAVIRQRREGIGMSQTVLADALNLSRTSVTNIERGRQPISLAHLFMAARAMGVSPQDLLPEDPDRDDSRAGRRTHEVESLLSLLRSSRRKTV